MKRLGLILFFAATLATDADAHTRPRAAWTGALIAVEHGTGVRYFAMPNGSRYRIPDLARAWSPSPADVNATGCTVAEINTAMAAATSGVSNFTTGDRVVLPACTTTITGAVTVSKNITIAGDGTGITSGGGGSWAGSSHITCQAVTGCFTLNTSNARITGFHLTLTVSGDTLINARGQYVLIDNMKLENGISGTKVGVSAAGALASGIPHPTVTVSKIESVGTRVLVQGDLGKAGQDTIWGQASKIGNPDQANVVYIEDSRFTMTAANAVDVNLGGRYVFRYNTVVGPTNIEVHSLQTGDIRASRNFEIYENDLTTASAFFACMFIRGGTGVVYNNTCNSTFTGFISLDNVRSFTVTPAPSGSCDGTSTWDGNVTAGWPCRDQLGRGADGVGAFPQPQASEPTYFWNNQKAGVGTNPTVVNCGSAVKVGGSCSDVVSGRDYITCTDSSCAKPGYTPYTYPHPFTGGGGGVPEMSLSPASLTFSAVQQVETSSATQVVTLTNIGGAVMNLTLPFTLSVDWTQTATTCGATLAASASCTITIAFRPRTAGPRSGTLSITDDAAGSPHTVALTGTALGVVNLGGSVPHEKE